MKVEFYKIKIKSIVKETQDVVSIVFQIPDILRDIFVYKAGQYITIKAIIEGIEVHRAYSISSSPFDKEERGTIQITVKQVDNGAISSYLVNEVKVGDYLEIMPPLGHFTFEPTISQYQNYVLCAAGSGITPIFSILRSILISEVQSKIYLFYQNRNEDSVIFKEKLQQLKEQFSERFIWYNFLSQPKEPNSSEKGKINQNVFAKQISNILKSEILQTIFYLCGPNSFMKEIEAGILSFGIEKNFIRKESFTVQIDEEGKNSDADNKELQRRKIKIKIYGEEKELIVEQDETVTTAAIKAGYAPPYSCQIGACSTCRAMLISGEVKMDEREALTDEEIQSGYILTCQTHPLSDNVLIDFDY
jgi:ring-1,2-phenylacetyl-CoA epoxidase subunit PaaE